MRTYINNIVDRGGIETRQEFVKRNIKWWRKHKAKDVYSHIPGSFIEPKEPIAMVHLDTDLYSCTKDSLELLYPKMPKGGIIIIDDVDKYYPGVGIATNEFFTGKPEHLLQFAFNQAVVIKK